MIFNAHIGNHRYADFTGCDTLTYETPDRNGFNLQYNCKQGQKGTQNCILSLIELIRNY